MSGGTKREATGWKQGIWWEDGVGAHSDDACKRSIETHANVIHTGVVWSKTHEAKISQNDA